MSLSVLAEQFAAEIKLQDWSDAPYRKDRAGHNRELDSPKKLTPQVDAGQTESIRLNVMWVTAAVLAANDPNFEVYEFAVACGCEGHTRGFIEAGIKSERAPGELVQPKGKKL